MAYNNCLDYAVRCGVRRSVSWPQAKSRAKTAAQKHTFVVNNNWTALAPAIGTIYYQIKGVDKVLEVFNAMFYGTPFSVHNFTEEGIHIHDDPFAGEVSVLYLAKYDPDSGLQPDIFNDVHFFRKSKKTGKTKGVSSSSDKVVRNVKLLDSNRFQQVGKLGEKTIHRPGAILHKFIIYDHGID